MSEASWIDDVVYSAEHLAFVAAVCEELDWLTRFASGGTEQERIGAMTVYSMVRNHRDRVAAHLASLFGYDLQRWWQKRPVGGPLAGLVFDDPKQLVAITTEARVP